MIPSHFAAGCTCVIQVTIVPMEPDMTPSSLVSRVPTTPSSTAPQSQTARLVPEASTVRDRVTQYPRPTAVLAGIVPAAPTVPTLQPMVDNVPPDTTARQVCYNNGLTLWLIALYYTLMSCSPDFTMGSSECKIWAIIIALVPRFFVPDFCQSCHDVICCDDMTLIYTQ